MSWIISGKSDPDFEAYVAAVEAADSATLEVGVRQAYYNFIVGCKADGIWDAIKASCILAGARTLAGALVPLVGTAPTNYNFVSGDYDRETGLKGDGSTKYLDSNRNNNADPQNSKHLAIYQSSISTINSLLLATANAFGRSALVSFAQGGISSRINSFTSTAQRGNAVGFAGAVRTSSTATSTRVGGADFPETVTSESPLNENLGVFATSDGQVAADARLSFYSIGESLDLALLDTRVTTLMSDLAAAIP